MDDVSNPFDPAAWASLTGVLGALVDAVVGYRDMLRAAGIPEEIIGPMLLDFHRRLMS